MVCTNLFIMSRQQVGLGCIVGNRFGTFPTKSLSALSQLCDTECEDVLSYT